MNINCRGRLLDLSVPAIMAVINVNDDSFFAESRATSIEEIVHKSEKLIHDGANIIDIGVMSSRPGAKLIDKEKEREILLPVIEGLKKRVPCLLSIDTVWASTAAACLDAGVDIINDISGGIHDSNMFSTIAGYDDVPMVLMHMKGLPETMQQQTNYQNIVLEMLGYFSTQVRKAKHQGIKDIIIDPGFGFSKTLEQNYEVLGKLEVFNILNLPVLAGLSRKSMIYKLLDTDPGHALNGTTVVNTIALLKGVKILRVHDAKEAAEAIKIIQTLSP